MFTVAYPLNRSTAGMSPPGFAVGSSVQPLHLCIYMYIYIFVYIYIYIYIPAAVTLIVEHTTTAYREYLYLSDVYIHKNSCLMHVGYCGSSSAHQALHSAPRMRAKESVLKLLVQAGAKQTSPYVLTPCPQTSTWRRTEWCKSVILR